MNRLAAAIVIGFVVAATGEAQEIPFSSNLADWYPTGPLRDESARWWAAEADFHTNWVVSVFGGRVRVRLEKLRAVEPAPLPFEIKQAEGEHHFGGFRQSIRVEDGWIVSFDHGEFGGEIWWFAPDGQQRNLFSRANVGDILPTATGIYLATRIAHGFDDGGQIERLVRGKGGKWSSEVALHLSSAPGAAIVEEGGTLLVATSKQLLRIDPASWKTTILVDDAPWHMLYPNSIAVERSGRVFVGMRHGVARFGPNGGADSGNWLIPCRSFDTNKRPPGLH